MAKEHSASKPEISPASEPGTDPTDPGVQALPGGGEITPAAITVLEYEIAEAEAPPDYGRIYELVAELPETWGKLSPNDRHGAVELAWLKYQASSYRLRGIGAEHAVVLALGWQDPNVTPGSRGKLTRGSGKRSAGTNLPWLWRGLLTNCRRLSPLSPRCRLRCRLKENGVVTGSSPFVASVASGLRGNATSGDEYELPSIAPGQPFPVSALGKFSTAVKDLNEILQAPLPICAASVMGSLSLVVQGVYNVEIDGSKSRPVFTC